MPEKNSMNERWVKFKRKWEFVRVTFLVGVEETIVACVGFEEIGLVVPFVAAGTPLSFADAIFEGRVSGRHR